MIIESHLDTRYLVDMNLRDTTSYVNLWMAEFTKENFNIPFKTDRYAELNYALAGCTKFNSQIDFWEQNNCSHMFDGCSIFNKPLLFYANTCYNMSYMFNNCPMMCSNIIIPNLPSIQSWHDVNVYRMFGGRTSSYSRINLIIGTAWNNVFNKSSASTSIVGASMSWMLAPLGSDYSYYEGTYKIYVYLRS